MNQAYSNSNREITISINDITDEYQETSEKVQDDDKSIKCGQIVNIVINSISKDGINVEILMKDGDTTKPGFIQAIHATDSIEKITKLADLNLMIGEEYKAVVIDISDKKIIQLSIQKMYYKI